MSLIKQIKLENNLYDIGAKWSNIDKENIVYGPSEIINFEDNKIEPLKKCIINIKAAQEGSGNPSPENVRPILGWTGTKLSYCGGNLVSDSWYSTSFSNSGVTGAKEGDSFVLNGVNTSSFGINWYIKRYGTASEFSLPAGTYTLSGISGPLADNAPMLSLYKRANDSNVQLVYCQQKAGFTSQTVTLTEYTEHLFLVIVVRAGSDVTGYTIKPMLEPGEDASEFSPYGSWNAINVPFPSTAYGGTLDVLTGVLTVTHGRIVYNGSETWTALGGGYYRRLSDMRLGLNNADALCDRFPFVVTTTVPGLQLGYDGNTSPSVYIRQAQTLTGAASAAELKAWLAENPITIVYPLATPIIYQLAPTIISSLFGQNYFWADCGDILIELENFYSDIQNEITTNLNENTLLYNKNCNLITSNHYITNDKISINSLDYSNNYNLYVNGTSYLKGDTKIFGKLALYNSSDVSGGAYIVAHNPTSWLNHVLPDAEGWIVTAGNGSSTGAGAASKPVYIDTDGVAKQVTSIDGSAISGIMPAPLYYSRGDSSDIFYIKTNISITSNAITWPAFQIFVTHNYTQGDSALITGSCYWDKTTFTASALNYYDPLKVVTSITAIQGDDNIFYLAIKPKLTYQCYSIFINTGNMGTQNAISVSTTAPTILVSADLVNKAP